MATWVVKLRQSNGGRTLNEFDLTVKANHKDDARIAALAQMEALSEGLQTIHVEDTTLANAARRPYRKLGWQGARTIVISIRRIKE